MTLRLKTKKISQLRFDKNLTKLDFMLKFHDKYNAGYTHAIRFGYFVILFRSEKEMNKTLNKANKHPKKYGELHYNNLHYFVPFR